MKAMIYHGLNDIRLEEILTPSPKIGEVLLRVKAASICGTDLRIIQSGHRAVKPPMIIGHEVSGIVERIGQGVTSVKEGDAVVVVTPVGCGTCRFCKKQMQNMCSRVSKDVHSLGYYTNGGFAEYMLIPSDAVANGNLIPFNLSQCSFSEAALVEPLSCVLNGMQFLHITAEDVVVIFGAGPIGSMHGLVAKSRGAKRVVLVEPFENKLQSARTIGVADDYINPDKISLGDVVHEITHGEGADVAITACPSGAAQEQALAITGIRGRISFFGGLPKDNAFIRLDSNNVHYGEKAIYGAFASSHPQYHEALHLIVSGSVPVKRLITHTIELSDFIDSIETIKRGEALKIVITPNAW